MAYFCDVRDETVKNESKKNTSRVNPLSRLNNVYAQNTPPTILITLMKLKYLMNISLSTIKKLNYISLKMPLR